MEGLYRLRNVVVESERERGAEVRGGIDGVN